jgi:DNA-directed RNA polymerase subunit RPC12/RpoP
MPRQLPNRKADFPIKLTVEERAQAGLDLVHLMVDYAEAERRQKSLKDQLKADLGIIQAKIDAQEKKVERSEEMRTVDVKVLLYEAGIDGSSNPVVQEIRSDNNEILITRLPYPDEFQQPLPDTTVEEGDELPGASVVVPVEGTEEEWAKLAYTAEVGMGAGTFVCKGCRADVPFTAADKEVECPNCHNKITLQRPANETPVTEKKKRGRPKRE